MTRPSPLLTRGALLLALSATGLMAQSAPPQTPAQLLNELSIQLVQKVSPALVRIRLEAATEEGRLESPETGTTILIAPTPLKAPTTLPQENPRPANRLRREREGALHPRLGAARWEGKSRMELLGLPVDGLILVQDLVGKESSRLSGQLMDGRRVELQEVARDPLRRWTLFRTSIPLGHLASSANRPLPGEWLWILGSSAGASQWIQAPPSVSLPGPMAIPRVGETVWVLNLQGELLGIGRDGYMLGISQVREQVSQLAQGKAIRRLEIGVRFSLVDHPAGASHKPGGKHKAVLVEEVFAGSPAEKAGLQPQDLILSLDCEPIVRLPTILPLLATRSGHVPMVILRKNQEMTLQLPLRGE